MKRLAWKPTLAAGMLCLLSACGGIGSQLEAGFTSRYNKPLCVDHLDRALGRHSLRGGGGAVGEMQRYLRASVPDWVSALLEEKIIQVRQTAGGGRKFSLTAKGRKYVDGGNRLCYGKTEFVKLLDYSEPAPSPGIGLVVRAQGLIRHRITASWARNRGFREKVRTGEERVTATFVKQKSAGWAIL